MSPSSFSNGMQKLYICEFTLSFFPQRDQLLRHIDKTKRRCPPGTEIYRNGNISMFEVDGATSLFIFYLDERERHFIFTTLLCHCRLQHHE